MSLEMQAKTDKSMPPLAVLPAATAETDPAASPAAASETHPATSPAAAISLPVEKPVSLYAFWGKKLYQAVRDESRTILNLASKEYSKAVEPAFAGRLLHHLYFWRMAKGYKSRHRKNNSKRNPGQNGPGRNGSLHGRTFH